jgi:ribonuclease HII
MPWVIGIDEAGYGPNLGPLVQAAIPLKLPEGDRAGWKSLRSVVRKADEEADHRLLIDDSKKVYSQFGLEALEHGVHAALMLIETTVGALIHKTGLPGAGDELAGETWYEADETAPVVAEHQAIQTALAAMANERPNGVGFGTPVASIVPAARFNKVCDKNGSKAAVLSLGLIELVSTALARLDDDGEPVTIHCDKHGGRNYYGAMVQEAFPDGWVVAEKETAIESRYRVELLNRPIKVIFRPRADGDSVAVALSSMLCKYLREICMRQFNRFWARHVPGLKPTAGYPGDASRYYTAIRPAMEKLGLSEDRVWRKR